jgi:hypothetical protein
METDLVTYQDAVDDLLDYFGEGRDRRAKRTAKRAILEAYRFLAGRHPWTVYSSLNRVTTVAPYRTGTIAYTHTGGSSERLVTLSGGTFPAAWTAYGVLTIDGLPYQVESYIDGTHLTLTAGSNPGADVDAGTSYVLHRDTYQLPIHVRSVGALRDLVNGYKPDYVSPDEWLEVIRGFTSTSCPTHYTILSEPEHYNSMAVRLAPSPDRQYAYDYTYDRRPAPLRTLDDGSGTLSVSGTTATASTGVFKSWHAGSVIRVGDATNKPTGTAGEYPYQYQRTIVAVTGTTTVTLDSSLGASVSAIKWTLSDPLDIDTGAMLDALMSESRARFARMLTLESATRLKGEARDAYVLAKAQDNKSTALGTFGPATATGGLPAARPFSVTGSTD